MTIKYANLIKRLALEKGDERASKCGYDLFMGMNDGTAEQRFQAWEDYLAATNGHADTERDGVWVPAICL